jgi:hypothetical protein
LTSAGTGSAGCGAELFPRSEEKELRPAWSRAPSATAAAKHAALRSPPVKVLAVHFPSTLEEPAASEGLKVEGLKVVEKRKSRCGRPVSLCDLETFRLSDAVRV